MKAQGLAAVLAEHLWCDRPNQAAAGDAAVREAVVRALYRDVDEFGIDMHEAALTHADAAVAALLAAVRAA